MIEISTYITVCLITLAVSCFIRGFTGKQYTKSDIVDSIFWPLTFLVIFGTIIRVFVNYIIEKFNKKGNK